MLGIALNVPLLRMEVLESNIGKKDKIYSEERVNFGSWVSGTFYTFLL